MKRAIFVMLQIYVSLHIFSQNLTVIDLGNAASETEHNVQTSFTEAVNYNYPSHWVMNVRASAFHQGHEPYRVIDGNPETCWQVSGPPPEPMAKGQWIELDLNRTITFEEISIQWIGDKSYDFIVYSKPFSDQRQQVFEGRSNGRSAESEHFQIGRRVKTRAIRIEFDTDENGGMQGIKEIRIGGLQYPDAYPLAVHPESPVEKSCRTYYVEFQRRMHRWPVFSMKRIYADGGTARRILHRDDAFEGGWIDFDVAIDPGKRNYITLKIWEFHEQLMTEHGNGLVMQVMEGPRKDKARYFYPSYMNEEKNWEFEWYGMKPSPGRFVYASYELPPEMTKDKTTIRLRIQGVGNMRRDYPMRAPAPPIYKIISHVQPVFDFPIN